MYNIITTSNMSTIGKFHCSTFDSYLAVTFLSETFLGVTDTMYMYIHYVTDAMYTCICSITVAYEQMLTNEY